MSGQGAGLAEHPGSTAGYVSAVLLALAPGSGQDDGHALYFDSMLIVEPKAHLLQRTLTAAV